MRELIRIQEVRRILNTGMEVNLKVWKKNGEIMVCERVHCLSSNFAGNTFNIKFRSGEIRKIRAVAMFEINGVEIIL